MCCPAQSVSPPVLCLLSPLPWLCPRPGALACLPLLFCVWLYCPLFVHFRGVEGLGKQLDSGGVYSEGKGLSLCSWLRGVPRPQRLPSLGPWF